MHRCDPVNNSRSVPTLYNISKEVFFPLTKMSQIIKIEVFRPLKLIYFLNITELIQKLRLLEQRYLKTPNLWHISISHFIWPQL